MRSLQLFYPENKIIIYDDNSNDMDLLSYYNTLKLNPKFEIVIAKNVLEPSKHGGLYSMMNLALEQAYIQHYKFAFFIQDDLQFLCYKNLNLWCENTFSKWKNILMISPVFLQKIYLPQISTFIDKKENDFQFKNYGVADIGIIHLERAKKANLNFNAKGEKYNGNKYFDLGYQLVLSSTPCLAWVPWAFSFKNKRRIGSFYHSKGDSYIKYINKKNVLKLKQNKKIPFFGRFL